MAGFRKQDLMGLFIDGEIARTIFLLDAGQLRNDCVHAVIQLGTVFGLTGYDQWCSCLIDQDRVHLVHDRVRQPALHTLGRQKHHVVPQIIEPEFAIRAVSDVCGIGVLL